MNISFHNTNPNTRDDTRAIETRRRHAIETRDKCLACVQALELKLGITSRWTPQSIEFEETGRMFAMRRYQLALDKLEGLVVARLFELTSMNRAQMGKHSIGHISLKNAEFQLIGYKQRTHISKALQSRSSTIRSALERYNTAAVALDPPRDTLKWDEVVEYAFLSDFDLLRDTRHQQNLVGAYCLWGSMELCTALSSSVQVPTCMYRSAQTL